MPPFCRRSILIACGLAMLPGVGAAQNYPSRPVKIVVPFPAGGSNDIVARVIAQKLSERNNGQTVFVENRGGAGGNIGAEAVANSDPDGYTLLLTAPPPLTINAALYRDLRYDPLTAFAPVGLIASVPIVLAVHPSTGIKNVGELIALAKAKPGTLFFGSSGNGSTNHLAGELLKSMTGIDIVHVPYKGAAPAMNDLVAGHIPMMFDNIPAVLPQVRAKNINAIAVAGSKTRERPARCAHGCRIRRARLRSLGLVRTGSAGKNTRAGACETGRRHRRDTENARCAEALRRTRRRTRHCLRRGVRKIPRRRDCEMDEDYPRVRRESGLAHDPEKCAAVLPKRSCSNESRPHLADRPRQCFVAAEHHDVAAIDRDRSRHRNGAAA